ncbi:histidine kinase [Aeromicrobium flavum]|uniref:Histidine kinase n=1 Tax=Aeromicrobium flavum TaxID=416568 RepID=A0A512HST9_9ACTN|nr:histidine kinase [Aeromicrobium flavum]
MPTARAIEDQLFAALGIVRVVLLLNAVGWNIHRRDNFQHPEAAVACVAVMVLWTFVANVSYGRPRLRTAQLVVVDLALAVVLMLVTPWVKGEGYRATVPGFWVAGALLAAALRFGWRGGFMAGVVLAVADIVPREELRQSDVGNAFLLILAGTIVGYLCASLQTMAAEREAAQREATAAAERARLARAVHDGVLQVLALVQRRGRELGGDLGELGALAGEQEDRLRRLIRAQDSLSVDADTFDLATALTGLEELPGVTVSTPGHPVEMGAATALEVVAAVRACLDNVRLHVGEDAPAWVLLQDRQDRVEVSVRDDGPGIAPGRLEIAAAEGRLGVSGSIRGRIRDLGGTAEVATGTFGTEWRFAVPRERPDTAYGRRHE